MKYDPDHHGFFLMKNVNTTTSWCFKSCVINTLWKLFTPSGSGTNSGTDGNGPKSQLLNKDFRGTIPLHPAASSGNKLQSVGLISRASGRRLHLNMESGRAKDPSTSYKSTVYSAARKEEVFTDCMERHLHSQRHL